MSNLKAECTAETIRIYRSASEEPILVQNAATDTRPFIHPILAPDGNGVLTEDAPPHHPWQHGLYTGLNDVNGFGFWKEGLGNSPKDGSFHPRPLEPAQVDSNVAHWGVSTDWHDPDGSELLTETQEWTLQDNGTTYQLDICWSLRAAVDLTFGQYAYGGPFLRMPYRRELGGTPLSSEGLSYSAADGQRALWVSCAIVVPDRPDSLGRAGIACLDHSANPQHPTPWRVDDALGICPSPCIAGQWQLERGAVQTFRYRFVIFTGDSDPDLLNQSWKNFATS